MICQCLRLGLGDVREGLLDRARDGGVKLHATALEQPGIGGIADQGVLETVSFGRQPAGE
jgi:hypothetical protein